MVLESHGREHIERHRPLNGWLPRPLGWQVSVVDAIKLTYGMPFT